LGLFDKHYPPDETATCEECGKEFSVDSMTHVEDYGWVCSECAKETDLVKCSRCYELFAPEDCTKLEDGSFVCMDCDGDLYWSAHE